MKNINTLIDKYKTTNELPLLGRHLRLKYDLDISYGMLNQNAILHITRTDGVDEDSVLFPAQEDATLIVIDEFFDIISKAPKKLYSMSNQFCAVKEISQKNSVSVKNMVEGHLVTVSKYKQSYLISTREDIHAYNKLVSGGTISVNTAMLDLLERANPYKGIEVLFENRSELPSEDICFTFMLSPKNGVYTDNVSDYKLYLISMYNRKTDAFYQPWQMISFTNNINAIVEYAIRVQSSVIAYSYDHVKAIAEERVKSPNIKGVLLNYTSEVSKSAYHIPCVCAETKPEVEQGINYNKFIGPIAKPFLENNYIAAMQVRYKHDELATVVQRFLESSKTSINSLFQQCRYSRTAKAFHLRVEHHPFKKVLMAMYRGDIKSTHELFRVVNIAKFTRELLKDPIYSNEVKKLIKEEVNGKNKRS